MTTFPAPTDPVSALTRADGTTEAHSIDHGRVIGIWENVKHHGAVGNGTTDDTTAINTAIAYVNAHGGSLFFPPGTYKVTSTISLANLTYLHLIGGHLGSQGLQQFDRAPQVVIDGSTIASGPTLYIDGGAGFAGGTHTLENLTVLGKETGVKLYGPARVVLNNCGIVAQTNTASADNCGLLMVDTFWNEIRDTTVHCPAGSEATVPAVILRGDNTSPNIQTSSAVFRSCVFVGENLIQQQTAADLAGGLEYHSCYTENTPGCFLRITESGVASRWIINQLVFEGCQIADAGAGDTPLVIHEAAHGQLRGPIFSSIASVPGGKLIKKTVADFNDAFGNGILGAVVTGSNRNGYKVVDNAGIPTGQIIMTKDLGFNLSGSSASVSETDITGNAGPMLRFARVGEVNAAAGIDSDGEHFWGPGGAGGGWDTTLYRSAADTLKTDDAFHVALAFRHLGTTLGFYNVAAVSRPSAYTQTYATAARTNPNATSSAVATTAATLVAYGYTQAQADSIPVAINAVESDVLDLKKLVNSIIDDLQANGLLQ